MNRLHLTGLLVLAWLVLTAGGVTYTPAPVTDQDVPPTQGQVWVKNRTAAVYDADSSVWLSVAEDAYYFGRNATTAGNEWMRFGPNGSASATGDPSIFSSAQGYYISVPSVITRVDLSLAGDWTAKAACTLMVCQSVAGAGIDTLSFVAFSSPDDLAGSRKKVWLEVDSCAVLSAKLLTGAGTVNNPNFTLRVRERRVP